MMKTLVLSPAAVLLLTAWGVCFAQQAPSPPNLPPSGTTAADALKASPRHGEWVDVPLAGSDIKIHTWVVYPERSDKAPVVIVIHEIFGMSDWVRGVADQLAAEGYIAIAPDMLSGMGPNGGGTESLADHVGENIRKLTLDDEVKRLDAVRDYAIALPAAKPQVASIGFCWGGGVSFAYATRQPKLDGAVVFYGTPPKSDAIANIACPVLGLYGGDDARITLTVDDTKKAMADAHKQYDPHVFDGAGHGFLRQQEGRNGANLKASRQAWAQTLVFLKTNLPLTAKRGAGQTQDREIIHVASNPAGSWVIGVIDGIGRLPDILGRRGSEGRITLCSGDSPGQGIGARARCQVD